MLENLVESDFSDLVGDKFLLCLTGDESVGVTLIEAKSLGSGKADDRTTRDPFSILFRGPKELNLPQAIYRLEHETLGSMDLFLVPIGPGDEGMDYEAVFT